MKLVTALLAFLVASTPVCGVEVVTIFNPDMELGDDLPLGWMGKFGQGEIKRDTSIFHGGTASLSLDRLNQKGRTGSAHQVVKVHPGMALKLQGWVKSRGKAKASFAAHFYDDDFGWNEFHVLAELEGDQEWLLASGDLIVPEKASRMAVGLYVEAQEIAWLDDVSLASENTLVRVPDSEAPPAPPMPPEDARLIPTLAIPGFYADSPKQWMLMHESHVKRAKQGDVELLFLGDSITQGWNHAPQVFDKAFGKWKTALFGIRGDKTGNLLWRLDHGEVDGLSPKVVVLLIGVNNLWGNANTDTEVAIGIVAVTDRIQLKLPHAKILLIGLLPTGEHIDLPVRNAILNVNRLLANAQLGEHIRYCDIGSSLLDEDGSISKGVMADFLHPTPLGYERAAKALGPIISEMMK